MKLLPGLSLLLLIGCSAHNPLGPSTANPSPTVVPTIPSISIYKNGVLGSVDGQTFSISQSGTMANPSSPWIGSAFSAQGVTDTLCGDTTTLLVAAPNASTLVVTFSLPGTADLSAYFPYGHLQYDGEIGSDIPAADTQLFVQPGDCTANPEIPTSYGTFTHVSVPLNGTANISYCPQTNGGRSFQSVSFNFTAVNGFVFPAQYQSNIVYYLDNLYLSEN